MTDSTGFCIHSLEILIQVDRVEGSSLWCNFPFPDTPQVLFWIWICGAGRPVQYKEFIVREPVRDGMSCTDMVCYPAESSH